MTEPRDLGIEITIEPDVVPRGTVDLRAMDAAPGAAPPPVRVAANGDVLPRGEVSKQLRRGSDEVPLLPGEVGEPAVAHASASHASASHASERHASDSGETKTLLAVDAAVNAPIPPRPAAAALGGVAAGGRLPGSESWEEFDPPDFGGGLSAAWSLAKVLVYLVVLAGGVTAIFLHFGKIAPWDESEIVELSPTPPLTSEIEPEVAAADPVATPEPTPAAETPALAVDGEVGEEVFQAESEPGQLLEVPQEALDALRLMVAGTEVTGDIGVEEDAPGLLARLEGLRARAVSAYRAEDFEQALAALEELLELSPGDADAMFRVGLVSHRRGDIERAKASYVEAFERAHSDPRPLNNLSLIFRAEGDVEQARKTLERALQVAPEDPHVLSNLAGILEREGAERALPLYDKALSVDSRHGPARLGRARVRRQLGDAEGAREDLSHLAGLDSPYRVQALDALGVLEQEAGRNAAAAGLHRQALSEQPSYAVARVNLGVALLDLGQHEEARVELETALAALPESARGWQALGVALTHLSADSPGLLYDAKDAYEKSIRLDGGDWLTHYNYAICAERFGNFLFAMREYERALELDPQAWQCYANLARLYRRGGDDEKALGLVERGLELAPDRPDLHFQHAYLLARGERSSEARAALERFVELAAEGDPRLEQARRGLGAQGPG